MVHLAAVKNDSAHGKTIDQKFEELDLGPSDDNGFTASVYGSKFAAMDIPKHEMPDDEMPRDIAYRLIK